MQVLDLSQPIQKQKVPANSVLMLQGSTVSSILVIHSGMAELLSREDFNAEMREDPRTLIGDSIRVGLVKGQSVCGIQGIYSDGPLDHSIISVSDCIITNTPVPDRMIVQSLQKNMRLNIQVLQALVQRIESAFYLFNNYKYLWHKLASIQDSIALTADLAETAEPESVPDRYQAGIEEYRDYLHYQLDQIGTRPPEPWDSNVFLGRLQKELDLYVEYDSLRFERMIDHPQYLFLKRLLRKQDRLVAAVFYRDEPTNFYVFQFLSSSLETLVRYNMGIARNIKSLSEHLYGDGGWVGRIIDLNLNANHSYQTYLHYLWKFSWRCHRDAIKLLSRDFTEEFPVYKKLLDFRNPPEMPAESTESADEQDNLFAGSEDSGGLTKYDNLFLRILEFSETGQEFRDEISSLLNRIKELDDITSADKEAVELKTRFTKLYWELYEICFLKIIDTDLKPFVPGIMLHFGLIDETMVTREELGVIDEAYSKLLYVDNPVPAMTLPYFLEKIYTGEINPSISEMGESFREVLKRQDKYTKKERAAADFYYSDKPEDKVRYELRQVASELGKMLFGSKRKALPILCSDVLQGNIDRLLLDPETCSEKAQMFHSRDYSLFFRETVCRHKFGTDIVKQEILPHFVIFPVAGSRMMMWQELDGTRKDSPARFMLPMYFMDKIDEGIGTLLAQFRWELSRSVAGANWMDPVEGGMSGAYYDYIQFYRKNPNLSPAHKEKLKEFIKKTRSDRDRFSSDYLTWLLYEYEGMLRFNAVARDIFYRFVPFDAEMRAQLAQKPLYSDLETKLKNRNRKEILKLESRFKKFEKSGETLPREMEDYMTFLNS